MSITEHLQSLTSSPEPLPDPLMPDPLMPDPLMPDPLMHVKKEGKDDVKTEKMCKPMFRNQCPYCNKVVSDASSLRTHTTTTHPDQFLNHVKQNDVSAEDFRVLCFNLVKQSRKDTISTTTTVRTKTNACLYCPKEYSGNIRLNQHLIDSHLSILAKEAERLQVDGMEELRLKCKMKGRPSGLQMPKRNKPSACPLCQQVFASAWVMRRHTREVHGQSDVSKENPKDESVSYHPCSNCGEKYSSKSNLDRHIKKYCKETVDSSLPSENEDVPPTPAPITRESILQDLLKDEALFPLNTEDKKNDLDIFRNIGPYKDFMDLSWHDLDFHLDIDLLSPCQDLLDIQVSDLLEM